MIVWVFFTCLCKYRYSVFLSGVIVLQSVLMQSWALSHNLASLCIMGYWRDVPSRYVALFVPWSPRIKSHALESRYKRHRAELPTLICFFFVRATSVFQLQRTIDAEASATPMSFAFWTVSIFCTNKLSVIAHQISEELCANKVSIGLPFPVTRVDTYRFECFSEMPSMHVLEIRMT